MWLIRKNNIRYHWYDLCRMFKSYRKKLNKLDDVNAQVNLTTEKATVEYNPLINMMSKNLLIRFNI